MKVVHLVTSGDVAGGQLVALHLIRAGRARGDDALVISPGPGSFVDVLRRENVPVAFLDVGRTFRLRDAWRLKQVLEREKADLLHTHTPLVANVLGRSAARLARVPVVSHLHIENYFRPNRLARAVHRALDNATARLCARIIVVSEDTRRAPVRQGYPDSSMETVYNGIEPHRPATHASMRGELGIPEDAPIVGSIGRLCAVKGQHDLIQALASLDNDRPAWLLLVGDDLEQGGAYKTYLESEASRLGIADRVVLTGYRPDVDAILRELDVFALASSTEGMPLVVLEAMRAAKPVVATPVGGTPEVVLEGETGLLIPVGQPEALARAVAALLGDPNRARRMGEAGRERVEQVFSAKAMTDRVLAIYDEVTATRGRGA